MTNPVRKVAIPIPDNAGRRPLRLGDSAPYFGDGNTDRLSGDFISWEDAAAISLEESHAGTVLVAFDELTTHEAHARHRALVNVCAKGTELLVASGPHHEDLSAVPRDSVLYPLETRQTPVSSIKAVLPFDARLVGVDHVGDGWCLFRFVLGELIKPELGDLDHVAQLLWTDGVFELYLGKGFYGLEDKDEERFSWMGAHGRILVKSNEARLIKLELWVQPFVQRPMRLNFRGNEYRFVAKTKITSFAPVIPGCNPFDLILDGEVESPLDRGLSSDSRKLGLKVIGGRVYGM